MSGALNQGVMQELYQLKPDDIISLMFFEPALAWKCRFKRPWPQGRIGERDTCGAQMHAPLLTIMVDEVAYADGRSTEFEARL